MSGSIDLMCMNELRLLNEGEERFCGKEIKLKSKRLDIVKIKRRKSGKGCERGSLRGVNE